MKSKWLYCNISW